MSGAAPEAASSTIEDYVAQDVPAILSAVRQATGSKKVVWIGHNLGACIALIFAAAHPAEQDMSIVAVGASMAGQGPYPPVLDDEAGACLRMMCVPSRFPSFAGDPSPGAPKGWEALFYNPEHMQAEVLETMVRTACGSVPPKVVKQFIAMLRGGELRSADGKTNYAEAMPRIKCPTFFICGKADNLAETGSVRRLYETVSSPDKGFRLFCLTNGDGADFGNADLLAGPRASVDVYPEVTQWAQKHL
jgi:pimeloyl-ACP methyl ester carboxylesterase